jgi:hypothetical protein
VTRTRLTLLRTAEFEGLAELLDVLVVKDADDDVDHEEVAKPELLSPLSSVEDEPGLDELAKTVEVDDIAVGTSVIGLPTVDVLETEFGGADAMEEGIGRVDVREGTGDENEPLIPASLPKSYQASCIKLRSYEAHRKFGENP